MTYHIPVLLHECIQGLKIQPDGVFVDVTFGGGGHSKAILNKLTTGRLIAFDQDTDAEQNLIDDARFTLVKQNFRFMKNNLKLMQCLPVDGILADLGISSHQIDFAERGFSTRFDAPLDMRMNRDQKLSAYEVINHNSEEQLKNIFKHYGELPDAGKIARHICNVRSDGSVKTTGRLCEILKPFRPTNKINKFLAQVFQAIRIEVNDELGSLKLLLTQAKEVLKPGGRLVIISYHSLEDKLVKQFIKHGKFEGEAEKDLYGNVKLPFIAVNRKPITASEQELERNSRARSASLRIAERTENI
ncbi:MAG: 16S rRNA (cytosine(1402)-N(4))-methyltransferase RsmH [Flavobacteriales bacterium]